MMTRSLESIRDELLVLRCQSGEQKALEELIARWQPRLWRHARRLTGRREAAWDVLQETLLAIVRSLHRLDDPALFRTWAYRIATHKSADWMRKQQRDRKLAEAVANNGNPRSLGIQQQREFESTHEPNDDVKRLHNAMGELSGDRQTILVMHYLDGMGIAEIAVALDIPAGTVKSRLYHARQQLKELLERTDS
ncbi:MAG: RNA polymerase sigma factor [Planctomycetes bacterium]|nr:RNA polymerase sigma factor [Planctomycetota bacterium]